MRLLVTGCGRSGTKWAADALTAAGVICGHERAFTPDLQDVDGWGSESSWLAAPHTPQPGAHTVHLVRHPLHTIASLAARGFSRPNRYGAYAAHHLPALNQIDDRVERCATYWMHWNQLIVADERVCIEDVTAADVTRWARKVNDRASLDGLPPPTHRSARRPDPLAWRQVACVPGLLDLASSYGYRP